MVNFFFQANHRIMGGCPKRAGEHFQIAGITDNNRLGFGFAFESPLITTAAEKNQRINLFFEGNNARISFIGRAVAGKSVTPPTLFSNPFL